MKKNLKIIIVAIVLMLLCQFLLMIFNTKHDSSYTIVTKDNKYKIKEEYENNNYLFSIKDKKKYEFVYQYHNDLNNKDKIITDILSYKKGNLNCIAPVFKDNIENIVCKLNNKLVSYEYLKQNNDNRVDSFIKKIEKSSYKHNFLWKNSNSIVSKKYNLSLYDGIPKDLYISMWNYSKVYLINNSEISKINLLKKDAYENNFSILVDKYYIVVNTDYSNYNNYFIIDMQTGKKELLKTKEEISKKIYFNGIYKNNLYLTDKDNEKQYMINPKKKTIDEVSPTYYNGKDLESIDIKDLILKDKYFSSNSEINNYQNKYCNYYTNKGYVYQKINNKKIILFKFDEFKEFKIKDNNIFGIYNDTLYMYNNKVGLKKVISNRELIYNTKNIYEVYKD